MMKTLRRSALAVAAASALFMSACAMPQPKADPEAPYPPEKPPEVGEIRHLPTGVRVTEEQMLAVATDARILYVGETHDNPASHRLELAALRAMEQRHPGRVALGMEMFTPSQQDALDRWVAGELSEKEFLKASRWYTTWRMDFDLYEPLLSFAREKRIPVIGLNAEKSLVREVRQKDFLDLGEEERALLPEIDMNDPYQRGTAEAIFADHSQGSSGTEGFLRVQTLWDEAMAESVAGYLGDGDRRMVVVAGGNHVRYGYGIPRRVFRRLSLSYALIGGREINIPEEKKERLMDVELPAMPMPPYDFVVYTEYEDFGHEKVRLGIMLEEEEGRVRSGKVLPGSNAETAGVLEGDLLLEFDDIPIEESFDLIYEVKKKSPGDRSVLLIERGGEQTSLEILFLESKGNGHDGKK